MFELSEDHELFRKVVRSSPEAEVAPHIAEWDRDHRFPVELIGKMGDLGLFGLIAPEQYGGAPVADFTSLCVAIEELGRVDQSCRHHPRSRRRPGHQPDPHLRDRGAEGRSLPPGPGRRPGLAWPSGSPSPEAGSDAGATAYHVPSWTTASGSSTARRRSSPTRARR